jgi:transcriptional regulator with XRE-family HTH domain
VTNRFVSNPFVTNWQNICLPKNTTKNHSKMERIKKDIRTSFGLTQQEMASLLGVSRGQWAMYEAGQRQLPQKASEVLTQMKLHLTAQAKERAWPARPAAALKQEHTHLERALRENEYQQIKLQRKIDKVSARQAAKVNAAQGVQLISSLFAKDEALGARLPAIANAARAKVRTDHSATLKKLERRQKMLAFEQQLLEEDMREVSSRLER